jgi:O-antigen ligase
MLVLVLLTAYALYAGVRKHKWVIPVAIFVVLALLFSQTRNTWLGAIAGIAVLILMWRPRAIVILLAAILIFYGLSPGTIKHRVRSIVDTTDPRIHVWLTALHLIQDNPWFGVGPKNVKYEAPKYREEREFPDWLKRCVQLLPNSSRYREEEKAFPGWLYQHMHNNPLQIAAETGIPGLIIWLWFMLRLAWDALRCYRHSRGHSFPAGEGLRREALMASSAALAAWVALMIAGMFEYNFGDSEVLTLFLFIVSAPYAFAVPRPEVQDSRIFTSGR